MRRAAEWELHVETPVTRRGVARAAGIRHAGRARAMEKPGQRGDSLRLVAFVALPSVLLITALYLTMAKPLTSGQTLDEPKQFATLIGAPLAGFVLGSIAFPGDIPDGMLPPVQGLSVLAAVARVGSLRFLWSKEEAPEIVEADPDRDVRRAALVASAGGAVGRALVTGVNARYFWWANRALCAFNGLTIAAAAGVLQWPNSPSSGAELLSLRLSFTGGLFVAGCYFFFALAFTLGNRSRIARVALRLVGKGG